MATANALAYSLDPVATFYIARKLVRHMTGSTIITRRNAQLFRNIGTVRVIVLLYQEYAVNSLDNRRILPSSR